MKGLMELSVKVLGKLLMLKFYM